MDSGYHPMIGPLTQICCKEENSKLTKYAKYGVYVNELFIAQMEFVKDEFYGECCLTTFQNGKTLLFQDSPEKLVNRFNMDGRR